jgi:branched-subunit amino acid ABC-type transport system permease component
VSILASGNFWAFVGVVAGIYTILALGLQVQFGFAGLLNFGQVAFMAIGAYTMAILVVKEGWSTWLAAPLGVAAAAVGGLLLGLSSLRLRADYFAIVTIAFSEIVRYVATNETSLTGGSHDRAWPGRDRKPVQRPVGALRGPRAGRTRLLLERRNDARHRVGGRARPACADVACASDAVGARAARNPR